MTVETGLTREREARILELGDGNYSHLRVIDGQVCGLGRFIFTWAVMVDMGEDIGAAPCRRRYCYEHWAQALAALLTWDGAGDPPGPWIKMKGIEGERLGPGALE